MKQFTYTVTDPNGIHARPAGLLVREAQKYESNITLARGGKSADLKKLFALMGLGVRQGDEITLCAQGSDEESAAANLQAFFQENF